MSSHNPAAASLTGKALSDHSIVIPIGALGLCIAFADLLIIQSGFWCNRVFGGSALNFSLREGMHAAHRTLIPAMLFIVVAAAFDCYRLPSLTRPARQLGPMLGAAALVLAGCVAASTHEPMALPSVAFAGGMLVLPCLLRPLWAALVRRLAAKGVLKGRPVIVIGLANELGGLMKFRLLLDYGLTEMRRFALRADTDLSTEALPGSVELAAEQARLSSAQAFVVATSWQQCSVLSPLVQALRASPLAVSLLPFEHHATTGTGRRSDLFDLRRAPIGQFGLTLKRLLDVTLAALLLLMLMPLLISVALAIWCDSPGPIIFRQTRSGLDRRPFTILKFRTMRVLENGDVVRQARRDDDRVTRIGRFLRRTSIDELPQLLNVLRGDMSLVGPRPHALAHDQLFGTLVEEYRMRHHVKPGITGWAQIGGARGEAMQPEQVQRRVTLDLWYIRNWSPILDVKILFRTALDIASHDAY